ncbi:MAG: hypothetical protein JXR76_11955 [Deltaproteobacteria bacterium]|nr:hypothetical protein [Deltaproteobacteria bacterium]
MKNGRKQSTASPLLKDMRFLALIVAMVLLCAPNVPAFDTRPYLAGALHTGRHTGKGADAYNMAPSGRLSFGVQLGRFVSMETTFQHGAIALEKVDSVDASGTFTVFFFTPRFDILGAFDRIQLSVGPTIGVGRMHLDAATMGVTTKAVNTGLYPGGHAALYYNFKNRHWGIGADVTYTIWLSQKSCVTSRGTTMCTGSKKWEKEGFVSFGGVVRVAFN